MSRMKISQLLKNSDIKCQNCGTILPIGRVEFIKNERIRGENKPFLCVRCQEEEEENQSSSYISCYPYHKYHDKDILVMIRDKVKKFLNEDDCFSI